MVKRSKKSQEGANQATDLKAEVKKYEDGANAKAGLLQSYREGHDIEFDIEQTYSLYEKIRDEMITKKDSGGIKLLGELVTKAWQYFEAIEIAHNALRRPDSKALLASDMFRRTAHDSFIDSLLKLESHLTSKYTGEPLGGGIYFPEHKQHLAKPHDSDERGYIRTFGFALLSGIRAHAEQK